MILEAARAQFAAHGFDSTTIRGIAASVRIDPALIIRYYESKEKLFRAVLDVDLQLPDLSEMPPGAVGEAIVRHFVAKWDDEAQREALLFLFRASMSNEIAAECLRKNFRERIVPYHAQQLSIPRAEAEHRAAAIMSELMGLGACRYLLRIPPLAKLSADELAAQFGPTIDRYLTEPMCRGRRSRRSVSR